MESTAYISTAGSGKTRALVHAAREFERGIAVTFTNEMANELKLRLPKDFRCSTIHSLAGSILSQVYNGKPEKLPPTYYNNQSRDRNLAKEAVVRTIAAIQKKPSDLADWIKFNRFEVLILDEAQDLSKELFELIKLLCDRGMQLVLAGDPDQNIYRFMGGDSMFMDWLIEDFTTEKVDLDVNYRSPQKIVDVANAVTGRHAKPRPDREDLGKVSFRELRLGSDLQEFVLEARPDEMIISPLRQDKYGFLSRLNFRTIHSTKGKEFEKVKLLLDCKGFQAIAWDDDLTLTRLLNVAVTRAKSSLEVCLLNTPEKPRTSWMRVPIAKLVGTCKLLGVK